MTEERLGSSGEAFTMKSDLINIRVSLLKKVEQLGRFAPVNLEHFARELGVVEIAPREIDFDGYLAMRPDGRLAIRYRADSPRTRVRFTIAHEIGHILIANELGRKLQTPLTRAHFRDNDEEKLANRVASGLLMPAKQATRLLRSARRGWETIRFLASSFDVSLSAAAVRLKELEEVSYLEIYSRLRPQDDSDISAAVVDTRRMKRILFDQHPRSLLARLKLEFTNQARALTQHSVTMITDNRWCTVQLLGWCRTVNSTQSVHFFGWQMNSNE